jgi:predicted PurR-regulated permease PerM
MKSSSAIDISTKTLIKFWLIPVILIVIGAILYSARTGLFVIGVSIFLAIALNPAVSKISNIFPGRNRVIATAIAYVLIVAILGTILAIAIPPIVSQVIAFIQNTATSLGDTLGDWSELAIVEQYNLQEVLDSIIISLQQSTASFASNIGSTVVQRC